MVAPVARDDGGGVLKVTTTGAVGFIEIAGVLALMLVLLAEVALITTVFENTVEGAV